jgi:hypothetical protein
VLSEEITYRLFLLLILIASYIATPLNLRALFLRLLQDANSWCESGPITHTAPSIYYGGVYHRLRHFRLIAAADGCVGHIGRVRQQLVENSGIRDVKLLTESIQSPMVLQ